MIQAWHRHEGHKTIGKGKGSFTRLTGSVEENLFMHDHRSIADDGAGCEEDWAKKERVNCGRETAEDEGDRQNAEHSHRSEVDHEMGWQP